MNKNLLITFSIVAAVAIVLTFSLSTEEQAATDAHTHNKTQTNSALDSTSLTLDDMALKQITPTATTKPSVPAEKKTEAKENLILTDETDFEKLRQIDPVIDKHPEFFSGDYQNLAHVSHYRMVVGSANVDDVKTPWSEEYLDMLQSLDSFKNAGIYEQKITCSSKNCLITGRVTKESHAKAILFELKDDRKLWGMGIDVARTDAGDFVFYLSKYKLDEDVFK